jgi:hypothetical protein
MDIERQRAGGREQIFVRKNPVGAGRPIDDSSQLDPVAIDVAA